MPITAKCPKIVLSEVDMLSERAPIAPVALYVAHYNLCRVHETLRITPAMALGVTDHIWTIGELVEAATAPVIPEPEGRAVGRFRVIDGDLV